MIDVSGLEAFAKACENARAEIKTYAGRTLDEIGEEFLEIVQSNIMAAGNVDTRLLLSSFSKGSGNGIYELDMGGLTLTIGTNVEYAKWVNDGHGQQPGRFIPGVWSGSRFTYVPGAKTGMVLKASYVSGSHFFDKSVQALESMFPGMVDKAFENFFKKYFP